MTRLLTHSSLSTFQRCPRRYEWRYECGLRPAREHESLRFGTAFHRGLDAYWLAGRDLAAGLSEVVSAYDQVPAWADPFTWAVERETVCRLLSAWHWRWSGDGLELIASEERFEVPLRNPATGARTPRWRRAGVWDRRVAGGDQGAPRRFVVEHKTTGMPIDPGSDYLLRLQVDAQVTRYLAAVAEVHGPHALLYDITRKPTIRPRRPTKAELATWTATGNYFDEPIGTEDNPFDGVDWERETPRMYGARLTTDILERPDFYFTRLEVARLDDDLRRFAAEDWTLQRWIARASRERSFPMNPSACLSMGRCPYADLCFAGITPENLERDGTPEGYVAGDVHPELSNHEEET